MVRIKNRILGIPEGKIGNVVYRTIQVKFTHLKDVILFSSLWMI
ncbi:MAG: hypothetical protein ACYCVH_11480 [Ignavibacteriaceae bacterium]